MAPSLKKGNYGQIAKRIRELSLKMVAASKSSHIGSSLSMADLLAVLYEKILRVKPTDPSWENRDRFILSKGHACAAVYAVLAIKGFFPEQWLNEYHQNNAKLGGHITSYGVPGVEVSSGSLGHGLPIACGMALAAKRENKKYRVFVMLSDGELDEGSNWEAILFASHNHLDNLVAVVDYNKIQAMGWTNETINLEPLARKWEAFGWSTKEIDGHNFAKIEKSLNGLPFEAGKPSCLIADTIKGKGVSFMENKLYWHYQYPTKEQLAKALKELR